VATAPQVPVAVLPVESMVAAPGIFTGQMRSLGDKVPRNWSKMLYYCTKFTVLLYKNQDLRGEVAELMAVNWVQSACHKQT